MALSKAFIRECGGRDKVHRLPSALVPYMHDVAVEAKAAHTNEHVAGSVVEAISSFLPFEPESIRNQLKRALKAGVSVASAKASSAAEAAATADTGAATTSATNAAAVAEPPTREQVVRATIETVAPEAESIDWTSGNRICNRIVCDFWSILC